MTSPEEIVSEHLHCASHEKALYYAKGQWNCLECNREEMEEAMYKTQRESWGNAGMGSIGPNYKYNEDNIILELKDYIRDTYTQHYSTDKYQASDMIIDAGHGEGFFMGNIMKYAKRYGKKGGYERKDLFKIIHYAIMMVSLHDNTTNSDKKEAQ